MPQQFCPNCKKSMEVEPKERKPGKKRKVMSSIELKLILPDSLANEARKSRLLTSDAIVALIREEVKRRRINKLFEAADLLANLDLQPLTEAEVEAEIEKVRKQNRAKYASSG